MFSSRLPPQVTPNTLGEAVARARRSGQVLLDLTETNPTRVGLSYPAAIVSSLADPASLVYAPEPLGSKVARAAVAAEYRRHGHDVPARQIVLTASTSEAYGMLFKLLCAPSESVLIPQPSYPLFELLTGLEGVEARPYQLDPHGRWTIDRASLEDAIGPGTRAVLVVSPNNPTGSMISGADREWLVGVCAARDLALIVDEVFADYPLRPRADSTTVIAEPRVLTCSLGGLSKSVGLPQMKVAWTVVSGPAHVRDAALARLEIIADTYLSVATPMQIALPALLDSGVVVRDAIRARVLRNLGRLEADAAAWPAIALVPPEGGWSAVLRVPATESEEQLVLRLLADAGVIVHPGFFYDFDQEAYLVVSLLPDPDIFDRALARLLPIAARGHE